MRASIEQRPYQERIATWLYEHDSALCVLRPGGGKTIAALTAFCDLKRDGVVRHALVIAPKRVARSVWPDEIREWAHTAGLNYAVLEGSPAQRGTALRLAPMRDMTIVGLDVIPWLLGELKLTSANNPIFDLLIIDEISKLRNPGGERVKKLAKEIDRWRMIWGLSGTLRPNSALDLFMPARLVTRGKLWGKSFYAWRQRHFHPVDWMGYDWQPITGAEELINEELAPWLVTVGEGEMPRVEPTIVLDRVELPDGAWNEYERMRRRLVAAVGKGDVVAESAAIATGKLAQLANGFIYDEEQVTNRVHDAKREWLKELIEDSTSPTLLIYEYRADLDMLRQELGQHLPYLGAGVSDKQAALNITSWNAGNLKFMALHPASGGHGLNLQHGGADMAWLAPTWSPEMWEQTIARLARPGQTRPVVIRVCVAADTVDELKLDRVHNKMSAQAAFEAWLCREQVSA